VILRSRSGAAIGLLALGVVLSVVAVTPSDGGAAPASALRTAIVIPSRAIPSSAASASLQLLPASLPAVAPTETPGGPIPDGYRIQIPRLGIDLPVQEGNVVRDIEEQRTPEGYAFHLPGTAIPGENGNTFLYAHARTGMFLALWDARPGDEVLVRVPNGPTLVYVVREVLPRVAPADVSTTRPTASEQLTLQTSTGPNPGDPRFVVLAFPLGG
jgi:LPXTG-site transpeptidase (sortase) family protein